MVQLLACTRLDKFGGERARRVAEGDDERVVCLRRVIGLFECGELPSEVQGKLTQARLGLSLSSFRARYRCRRSQERMGLLFYQTRCPRSSLS